MKIVIIGTAYPYRGGIAAFNERLAHQLQTENHEVKILTFTLQYPDFLFPGKTQYSTEACSYNLTISRVLSSVNPITWRRTALQASEENPDLVIFGYWMPFLAIQFGYIARIIKNRCQAKIVSVLHNIIPHEKHFFDHPLTQYFMNSNDGFVALSKSVLDDIDAFDKVKPRKFSPHPIYDIYGQKIDRDRALDLLGLDDKVRYVLFFGFIRDYKGLDLLMRAMADCRLKQMAVKLIVAGEFYSDEKKYKELETELQLKDSIIWHTQEFIPDTNVNRYFSAADIVAQPYRTATQSGVTQVAYHFEKPMLVTNVGGLPEIVPDGKVGYVTEVNPTAIADALVDFFQYNRQHEFDAEIKSEKQKYAWETLVRNLLEVAKEC